MLQVVQRSAASHIYATASPRTCLHTSCIASAQLTKKWTGTNNNNKNASRTRLTKDLESRSHGFDKRTRLEVAPREDRTRRERVYPQGQRTASLDGKRRSLEEQEHRPSRSRDRRPSFERESVPHADAKHAVPVRRESERSFRRQPRRTELSERGRGRWGADGVRNTEGREGHRDEGRDYSGKPSPTERRPGSSQSYSQSGRGKYASAVNSDQPPRQIRNHVPLSDEFFYPPSTEPPQAPSYAADETDAGNTNQLSTGFNSPPIMPGILSCLRGVLGPSATPTPIQTLSMKWLLNNPGTGAPELGADSGWKQFLLASETGSGKSIAYLLPVLQNLKQSEPHHSSTSIPSDTNGPQRSLNPRALILAPTHELARQLSGFAKALLHEVKLRVLCASRANVKNTKEKDSTSSRMMNVQFDNDLGTATGEGEFEVKKDKFPVDLVVGTPMKLLEMVRGRGWDRKEVESGEKVDGKEEEEQKKLRRGRDKMIGYGKWRSQPEMGLANVEWVVVDEADVLFDPDFQETTRQLLSDISEARGVHISVDSSSARTIAAPSPLASSGIEKQPINYPFNLILTSATIPSALAKYLDKHHPDLTRLASPRLHHLPKTLQTEYVSWTGGNKYADIERRIKRVWAEDASLRGLVSPVDGPGGDREGKLSKILIFCNRSGKVDALGEYLTDKGIKNVALTSTSEQRKRGSNHHLDGFLRAKATGDNAAPSQVQGAVSTSSATSVKAVSAGAPRVMITTSLLSRGLDFSPEIRHVFIVDEPRNMIDFLHRAGRAGRAGERGKVVVFGKMKGRGSAKAKEVRTRVGALTA